MSTFDWMPELAAVLDRLVPADETTRADWDDVVERAGRRRAVGPARGRPRRLRVALVVALLFGLLTGVATATYLLVRGNGTIAVEGASGALLVVNPNGSGLRTVARCPAGARSCAVLQPAWSPDGRRLAFVRRGPSGGMSLYVAAAEAGGARRLAACGGCGGQWGARLGWSPDGRWIAFSRDAGPTGQASLWVVAAAGGPARRLTDCRRDWCADVIPGWSPDGKLVVFQRIAPAASNTLYTVRPDGTNLTKIARGADPHWSPDGTRIAFDGSDGIDVANADGSGVRLLAAGTGGTGPGAPSWSPDGSKLVFLRTPGRPGHYTAQVWTINANGSAKKLLYRSGCCVMDWAAPVWSPDGRKIAFSADSAGGTFVINADGSGLRRLSPTTSSSLAWQQRPR